ncbi:hypothetical protein D3C78_1549530 [compost metagenome]
MIIRAITSATAGLAETRVEQHEVRAGIYENRREGIDELLLRQKIVFQQFADRFRRLIRAEGLAGIGCGARAVLHHEHFEIAELEAVGFRRHGVFDLHGSLRLVGLGICAARHQKRRAENACTGRTDEAASAHAQGLGHHLSPDIANWP